MRPSLLDPLFAPVTTLPGVGPKLAILHDRLLARPGEQARVLDLLFHLPTGGISRALSASIAEAPLDQTVTFAAHVVEHRPVPAGRGRAPYRVLVEDESGDVTLAFFKADPARMRHLLPVGEVRYVSGTIELWEGRRQMVHPERVLDAAAFARLPEIEPVYPLTEGLSARMVGRAAQAALARLPALPEWQQPALLGREGWPGFAAALAALHAPSSVDSASPDSPAWRRLAYDEMLASQLALALVRAAQKRLPGRVMAGDGTLVRRLEAALPYALTGAQRRALADIRRDLAAPERMLRLLQGDVGSGKTVVALLAMAMAAETGRQAALMAPTDLLARQHLERIAPLAAAIGLDVAVLTGRDKGAHRASLRERLADGRTHLAIGTHALFQDGVVFRDLGLAVVDEQHRFGVHQRLALGDKGDGVDVLVMTATPIPRTLALTFFGDMDVSVLDEKPPGRQPIATRAVPLERLDEVVAGLARAVAAGAQAYWVCPLVEENTALDVAAATERRAALEAVFGPGVDLLHGQMPARAKDLAMARFAAGETRVLVSTTVIEVGVDVPAATIMVIEHAERFGLAQLHQLRGRIGRGRAASSCVLLYKGPLGPVAEARLAILRESEDGFRIAEEDLRLRGEGEVLGTRQSGLPGFRVARPDAHAALLPVARDEARLIVATDPRLEGPRGGALRVLLHLFERDAAVRLLRAG